MDMLFRGLFDTNITQVISVMDFILCIGFALLSGLILALMYIYNTRYTKSFVSTLAILPSVVCVVIMMVNGNFGAGLAVAGAFSLVRFRSAPGSAREISAIFMAMSSGLIAGMGYLGYTLLFTIVIGGINMIYSYIDFGAKKQSEKYKILNITIPENLDYTGVFDDILLKYTKVYELTHVRSTNMGSMFKLTYNITLKKVEYEKSFIDELRCRNGNLEISVSKQDTLITEL